MYIEGNSQPKYAMYNSMRACICMCMYVYANVYNNVSRLMSWWRWGGMEGGGLGRGEGREEGKLRKITEICLFNTKENTDVGGKGGRCRKQE